MSYARFSKDSNVYVYQSADGFECCGCWMQDDASATTFDTAAEMVDHLRLHQQVGHLVPQGCIDALLAEGKP